MLDYLDRAALLALDLDPAVVDRLLADSPLSGHGGRPLIDAAQLPDLLAQIEQEGHRL